MTLREFHSWLERVRRAVFGIVLGGSSVIWIIEGSRGLGWPVGNEGLEHAAVTVTAIAAAVWVGCRLHARSS